MIGEGQQLGGYQVVRKIGQGGMGDVFMAQHLRVSRRAAVKVLLPELSQKATVLDRFFNEARATSLIKHPGIVEIIDCDVLDAQAFIIMEYLEGESLGSYMNRTGALAQDPPFLLGVSSSIASAVGAAHSAGIVHRDLKPDNVYLHLASTTDPVVTVKILDFGIAKLLQQQDGGPGTNKTQMGMMLGTPPYMSPEQCRDAGQVDKRCDIYSLGCILYELVSGAPPFVYENATDMIVAHLSEVPEPLIARVPKMLPSLNALIMRMLAKKPDQRPQTMDEVVNELGLCARSMGLSVDKPLRPRMVVERPPELAGFLPTQMATGVPRSQVTPMPGSGAIANRNPSLRPATPYPQSGPVSMLDPGRKRTGPQQTLEPPAVGHVGGTRVMDAVRPTTTMGSAAAEVGPAPRPAASAGRGRMFAMVGAAVVVVGGIAAVVLSGGSSKKVAAVVEPPAPVVAAPAPEKVAPPPAPEPPPVDPKPIVAAPALPATVRLDLQGLPARTTITVDGRPASLPVQLPRGAQVHHVVLKPPSGPEKTFDYDGSVDRVVEVIFEKKTTSTVSSSGGSESGHRSHDKGAGKKKPGAGDRDAILDL